MSFWSRITGRDRKDEKSKAEPVDAEAPPQETAADTEPAQASISAHIDLDPEPSSATVTVTAESLPERAEQEDQAAHQPIPAADTSDDADLPDQISLEEEQEQIAENKSEGGRQSKADKRRSRRKKRRGKKKKTSLTVEEVITEAAVADQEPDQVEKADQDGFESESKPGTLEPVGTRDAELHEAGPEPQTEDVHDITEQDTLGLAENNAPENDAMSPDHRADVGMVEPNDSVDRIDVEDDASSPENEPLSNKGGAEEESEDETFGESGGADETDEKGTSNDSDYTARDQSNDEELGSSIGTEGRVEEPAVPLTAAESEVPLSVDENVPSPALSEEIAVGEDNLAEVGEPDLAGVLASLRSPVREQTPLSSNGSDKVWTEIESRWRAMRKP